MILAVVNTVYAIVNVTIPLFKLRVDVTQPDKRWHNKIRKQQYGIIEGDTALWQVWRDFMVGAQTKGLTYSPTNVGIEREYWQSLSYLPSTAQHKIKARI